MAKITVDITKLTGYSTASLGTHQLTIISEADGYINSDPSSPVTFINGYSISFNLTHCTRTPASNVVDRFNNTTFTITANTNYKLPASITVTGSKYDWNSSTGVLVIKEVTGQVSVTITATQDVFAITKSATNGTWTGPSTISAGGLETLTLTPSTNYKLPTSVTVTGATQSWDASTGKLVLTKPTGSVNVTATCPIITYTITETLTNVSKSGTHPTTINAGSTVTLKYTASANYKLPASVTVTGATSNWTQSTGTLVISNPTANVSITVVAERITYSITETLTNVTKTGTHPTFIAAGGTLALTYSAASGYELPTSVTVTGCEHDWKQSTATLSIFNATTSVVITIAGVQPQPQLATPTNVSATGTVLSWDAVENAESYDIYAGETLIGNTDGDGYAITTTITNGTYSGDSRVVPGGTATVTITANDGYTLPDEVTVTGATGAWNKTTGTLAISNPTGNVTVTGECVSVQTGETWVFNETISFLPNDATGNFVSNDEEFRAMEGGNDDEDFWVVYRKLNGNLVIAASGSSGDLKMKDAYRTVTFETAPTGDFLTWLQANAVKQGSAALITFTINGTSYQAEEGMTWAQWIASSYNIDKWVIGRYEQVAEYENSTIGVYKPGTYTWVEKNDVIIANSEYTSGDIQ